MAGRHDHHDHDGSRDHDECNRSAGIGRINSWCRPRRPVIYEEPAEGKLRGLEPLHFPVEMRLELRRLLFGCVAPVVRVQAICLPALRDVTVLRTAPRLVHPGMTAPRLRVIEQCVRSVTEGFEPSSAKSKCRVNAAPPAEKHLRDYPWLSVTCSKCAQNVLTGRSPLSFPVRFPTVASRSTRQ